MDFEDADRSFTPPIAADLVTFRSIAGTLFATITSDAISSVEVKAIREALDAAMEQAPESLRYFVLDVEQVQFINSEAISVLITLHSAAKIRGAKLVLAGVTNPVAEILVAARLAKVLTICMTQKQLDEALGGGAR